MKRLQNPWLRAAVQIARPDGIAVDSQGNVFVAASGLAMVLKIDTNGPVNLVASQVDVTVPSGIAAAAQAPLILAQSGSSPGGVTIPVQ